MKNSNKCCSLIINLYLRYNYNISILYLVHGKYLDPLILDWILIKNKEQYRIYYNLSNILTRHHRMNIPRLWKVIFKLRECNNQTNLRHYLFIKESPAKKRTKICTNLLKYTDYTITNLDHASKRKNFRNFLTYQIFSF